MTAARGYALGAALALAFAALLALGGWQLERRAWKHTLIARVEQRIHAAPVAAPGPADWPLVSAARDEYRRVRVAGRFRHDAQTLVQAVTERGAGWWVLTPLQQADGTIVLVNRGFAASARSAAEPDSEVVIVGLLRLSEPGGGFLRRNDPAAGRWYSRDVAAIGAARRLERVAPYFVDAERSATADADAPVGGLTVTDFRDPHLAYALTWFALAAMVAGAAVVALRLERRVSPPASPRPVP